MWENEGREIELLMKDTLTKGSQIKAKKNGWKRNVKDSIHESFMFMRAGEVFTIISNHLDGVVSPSDYTYNVESKGQIYRITHDELFDYEVL